MSIVDKKMVLCLNANWQAIGVRTVGEAFVAMMGGNNENPPVKALDISYPRNNDDSYDYSNPSITPVSWVEWMALPIREFDYVVNTARNKIRVPTVVVAVNYKQMPKKRFRPTKQVLLELQQYICGLTGKKITAGQANIEHKVPKSDGGKDTFENLMAVDKRANNARGNKPYAELGLKPLFNHKEPAPIPVSFAIKNIAHQDWKLFLNVD